MWSRRFRLQALSNCSVRENSGMVHAKDKVAALRPATEPAEELRPGLSRRIIRTDQLMSVALDIEGGPWKEPEAFHSHPHEQTTYVASGEVLFCSEGSAPERLIAGDLIAIPSGVPHSIQLLSASARLVDTFYPVREDFIK
jgi:mannose-6-phosphate isomerase-like protein (cupin superfamily)